VILRDGGCRRCWENTNGDCGLHGPLIIGTGYPHKIEPDEVFGVPMIAEERLLPDNPVWDSTDYAHPAWWRGHQHTAEEFCRLVNEILDGKDDGRGFNYQPWHDTRRRILGLVDALRTLMDTPTDQYGNDVVMLREELDALQSASRALLARLGDPPIPEIEVMQRLLR
jgi:hypothetical protein